MRVGVSKRDSRQKGATLAVVALMLILFLALAALAVDMGILYTARTSAQHAADAAALAGAFTFLNPFSTQPGDAQNAAIKVAAQNKILGTPVTITNADVNVDLTNRLVTVTVSRLGTNGIGTVFARALGISNVDIRTVATAEASTTATSSSCTKPVFFPNTLISGLDPSAACGDPSKWIFNVSGGVASVTAYARSQMGGCFLTRPTTPADVQTQSAIGRGQFYSLDFGSGADTYRCTWASCLNDASCNVDEDIIECWNEYPVKTGDMVGPTNQGVGDMIGDPPDTYYSPGQYIKGGTSAPPYFDTSRSLGLFPVWDNCSDPISSGTAGQTAQVIGFVEVFVDGMSNQNGCTTPGGGGGSWVKIHPINAIGCGDPNLGGNNPNPVTGPFATPVRLVQTP